MDVDEKYSSTSERNIYTHFRPSETFTGKFGLSLHHTYTTNLRNMGPGLRLR
ncbi:hypothetical protein RirG_113320 [Rhizophagus irregularis DAOM 197198w]|uniref:Uncharacterized protein n=1 Tax=Rhizophagus irregularis (strain DAOM 197198w) TaxID=1432141 RepID=A0A015JK55_RHIIW|nr:hypothetical protein RirG_113320 [Rhizophagus irregularis DAOM 197198w]